MIFNSKVSESVYEYPLWANITNTLNNSDTVDIGYSDIGYSDILDIVI